MAEVPSNIIAWIDWRSRSKRPRPQPNRSKQRGLPWAWGEHRLHRSSTQGRRPPRPQSNVADGRLRLLYVRRFGGSGDLISIENGLHSTPTGHESQATAFIGRLVHARNRHPTPGKPPVVKLDKLRIHFSSSSALMTPRTRTRKITGKAKQFTYGFGLRLGTGRARTDQNRHENRS